MSNQVSTNVRFLLWRSGVSRQDWVSWLDSRSSLGLYVVREMVSGAMADDHITGVHLQELSRVLDLGDEGESTLRFEDLPQSRTNVLAENLRFLIDQLPHGGKQQLARRVGVDPATISRWRNGSFPPEGPSLRSLVHAFGLPSETDLKRTPVFLSLDPISSTEQRKWVRERVDSLDPDQLQQLFPALKRMLEEK